MPKERTYYCIDMKCFFASVECAERGLNPFETCLVVADEERGCNALCLAISPKLKSLGVKNRCRLSEIPKNIQYIIAKPRMKKYIDYAADIYDVYLDFISPDDIHVYSIDEAFLDVTPYLERRRMNEMEFASFLINRIAKKKHIPATAGIGTNLFLAKVALDITAKKTKNHIGYLNEELFKETLWHHRPITDFWQIAGGTANRLARYGIYDMKGIADTPEKLLYKVFGINAELLIDHAWGRESCTIADIKSYKSKSKSVSLSQILFEDYTFDKALLVILEMALSGCQEMMRREVISGNVSIGVGYSKDLIPPTGGSVSLNSATNVFSIIRENVIRLYHKTTNRFCPIRRLSISFNNVVGDGCEGYDFFTDIEKIEKERNIEKAVLGIKDRFGKNAVLRGFDLEEGATARVRNTLIGGHNGE